MTIRMKRQSTTQKLTRKAMVSLCCALRWGADEFIVRHKGREYGVVSCTEERLTTIEGITLYYSHCTIRRDTVNAVLDSIACNHGVI